MRILITGGAGFLGSQLSGEFLARGHRVRVLDDLSTGSKENLSQLQGKALEFEQGSVRDREIVGRAMQGCEAVVHLAARVGVRLLFADPEATFRENWEGCRIVLDEAAARRLPILYASSSEVYSKGFDRPLGEESASLEDLPLRPRFLYGRSKLLGEIHLEERAAAFGIPARALRFFNMVGPRQSARYGMVIPRLIAQAKQGIPLTVYGNGEQRRCFACVEEVAPIAASLLPSKPGFDVLNLGSQHSIRIVDLAREILEATGSASPLQFLDPHREIGSSFEDFPSRVPDLTKLQALGFAPPQKTIAEMMPWLLSTSLPQSASASCA